MNAQIMKTTQQSIRASQRHMMENQEPKQNCLTELIEQNRSLLEEKKRSYKQKISKYKEKLKALQKCLLEVNNELRDEEGILDEEDEELEENKLIIERKMTQINSKVNQYEERLQKLNQIESQMDEYMHNDESQSCVNQHEQTCHVSKRSKSISSSKSRQSHSHKPATKKSKHNRQLSREDLRPNIFNTPISKSFSKNAQNDENNTHNWRRMKDCTNEKNDRNKQKRVPLGQLLNGQELLQKDDRQIAKFFYITSGNKLNSTQHNHSLCTPETQLAPCHNNTHLQGMINMQQKSQQECRTRTKSVPTIYPFGRSEHSSSKKSYTKNPQYQQSVDISVAQEYIYSIGETLAQLFKKYPFITESCSDFSTFNPKSQSHINLSLYQSLHIMLNFLQSQQQKLALMKEQRQRQENVLSRISCEKRTMKNLEYDKIGLEQEVDQFQIRVKELIEHERKLLQSIDNIEDMKTGIIADMRAEIARLRSAVEDRTAQGRFSQFHNAGKLQIVSSFNCYLHDISGQETSMLKQVFEEVKKIKHELARYMSEQNGLFGEISASKCKLESNLEKIRAEHEMIKIKKEKLVGELAQTTLGYQEMTRQAAKLEQSIQQLKDIINQQSSQKQSLTTCINQLSCIIQTKKESIRSLDQTIGKKKHKKKELFQMVEKMEKVLEEAEEERLKMVEANYQEKDQWEELIKENQEVERLNTVGKEKLNQLKTQGKRLQQEHKEMMCKLAQQTEKLQEKDKTKTLMEAELQKLSQKKSQTEANIASQAQQDLKLSQSIAMKASQIAQLDQEINSKQAQMKRLSNECTIKSESMSKLEKKLQQREEQISVISNRISIAEINLRNTQRQEQVANQNIVQHQNKVTNLEATQSQMEAKIQETLTTKQELQELVLEILEQKQLYLSELEAKNQQLLQIQQKIHLGNRKHQEMQQQIRHLEIHEDSLQEAISQLTGTAQILEQEMQELHSDQAETILRLKILNRLELKKCLHHGLTLDHQQISPEEHHMITQRIEEVVTQLQDYQSTRNKHSS